MAGIPIEPAGPPDAEAFAQRAADLTPEDASDEVRARIGEVAAHARRRAEREWEKRQSEAGIAVLDWLGKNPNGSLLAIPPAIRDWLAPDQWRGLETFYIEGRLSTDRDLFEQLDRQMVHEPDAFAGLDLDRHRLSLDDEDHARFAAAQKVIVDGTSEPTFIRYRRARLDADRKLEVRGADTDSPEARVVRRNVRDRLESFETVEGRLPYGHDIAIIVDDEVARDGHDGSPVPGQASDTAGDEVDIAGRPPFIVPRILPPRPGTAPRFKEPIPGMSGKDGAKDVPGWAKGYRPLVGQRGKEGAKRVMDERYGPGNWTKIGREYQWLKKYFDRSFRDPKPAILLDMEAQRMRPEIFAGNQIASIN